MPDFNRDPSPESTAPATPLWRNPTTARWLASAAVLAVGLIAGGYLLGNGLVRAREADRSVTVRGLAERDVTANLATWTVAYSATAPDLATAQASVERDTGQIRAFFHDAGFPDSAIQPTGASVSQSSDQGVTRFAVSQRLILRTTDIARAEASVKRQFDLVRRGVVLEPGSGISYAFTRLNGVKPAMVAQATRDARASAEQFAKDSGASVGAIKSASQGYFSISDRDGEGEEGSGGSDTPYKKVRVVTTVDFFLR